MTWIRALTVRGLAACHVVALLSFAWQADILVGPQGLAPVGERLRLIAENGGMASTPTLLWFWPTLGGVYALCAVGLVLAVALIAGLPWEGPALLAAWAVYLSICTVADPFLSFQWDTLLLEATFVALLVARWTRNAPDPPRWAWWALWWLVFRLMFFGGWVKIASGDPTWADFTALDYHFWTQPLPNPVSRWAAHWPHAVHAVGVGFTFAVELLAPWPIPFGRWPRLVAAAAFTSLMGMLAFTGNYGFFQLLAVVLCVPLLDDGFVPAWLGRRLGPETPGRPWRVNLGLPVALGWAFLTLLWIPGFRALPRPAQQLLVWAAPFRSANPYGLFAVMTTDRIEIVFEGSWDDGATWRELDLRYKPGPVDRVPAQIAPHMPRVDWQLWFAALGTCRDNPWVPWLMQRTVDGSEPIERLFVPGTFDRGPPDAMRAQAFRYRFTEPGAADVWSREPLGLYCPQVVRRTPGK